MRFRFVEVWIGYRNRATSKKPFFNFLHYMRRTSFLDISRVPGCKIWSAMLNSGWLIARRIIKNGYLLTSHSQFIDSLVSKRLINRKLGFTDITISILIWLRNEVQRGNSSSSKLVERENMKLVQKIFWGVLGSWNIVAPSDLEEHRYHSYSSVLLLLYPILNKRMPIEL